MLPNDSLPLHHHLVRLFAGILLTGAVVFIRDLSDDVSSEQKASATVQTLLFHYHSVSIVGRAHELQLMDHGPIPSPTEFHFLMKLVPSLGSCFLRLRSRNPASYRRSTGKVSYSQSVLVTEILLLKERLCNVLAHEFQQLWLISNLTIYSKFDILFDVRRAGRYNWFENSFNVTIQSD
ncbi:hypothetical protein AALP_AA8G250100 [Arabis alpina]|uniref:Uncharacterized protein n=1 Tax=Arabis alpina TaxID=50452 RepID=A0A087G998_ARAAL|nr:hypothetical protein AALP_AA8G250100 [Arabis alpina]